MVKKYFFILIFVFTVAFDHVALPKTHRNSRSVKRIQQIIDNNSHMHIGCEVYSLKQQKTIYSVHGNKLFTPASNTKLLTGILALELLGSGYRFPTQLITDGVIQKNSIVGNLYIKGSGDPSLGATDLEDMIKYLSDQHITSISGDFCIDTEDFDQVYFAPGSLLDNLGASWNNLVGACMVDRKPLGLHPVNEVSFMDNKPLQGMFFDGITFVNSMLQKYGISFSGEIVFKKCPAQSMVMYTHYSQELSTCIGHMLKKSDNLCADCLFKKLGAVHAGYPGTWLNGARAFSDFLQNSINLTCHDFLLKDGSGRSRYNLLSPHDIVLLLQWAYKRPYFTVFLNSLSIAGVDGTLKSRMADIASAVKAKTGTLAGVSGLSGYIETAHDVLAFSIMVNGYVSDSINNPPCKSQVEDAICGILVTL